MVPRTNERGLRRRQTGLVPLPPTQLARIRAATQVVSMSSTSISRKLVERTVGDKLLSIETGHLAKQATGAVVVRIGDTMTLVAVVAGPGREGLDFFPLTVDYREKTYAAGKFPGGFIKREGRPTTKEILTSRLIDRPVRPLFPRRIATRSRSTPARFPPIARTMRTCSRSSAHRRPWCWRAFPSWARSERSGWDGSMASSWHSRPHSRWRAAIST